MLLWQHEAENLQRHLQLIPRDTKNYKKIDRRLKAWLSPMNHVVHPVGTYLSFFSMKLPGELLFLNGGLMISVPVKSEGSLAKCWRWGKLQRTVGSTISTSYFTQERRGQALTVLLKG